MYSFYSDHSELSGQDNFFHKTESTYTRIYFVIPSQVLRPLRRVGGLRDVVAPGAANGRGHAAQQAAGKEQAEPEGVESALNALLRRVIKRDPKNITSNTYKKV